MWFFNLVFSVTISPFIDINRKFPSFPIRHTLRPKSQIDRSLFHPLDEILSNLQKRFSLRLWEVKHQKGDTERVQSGNEPKGKRIYVVLEHDPTPDMQHSKRPCEIYTKARADARCSCVHWEYLVRDNERYAGQS